MEVNILAFGQIADIANKREWKISGVTRISDVRKKLEDDFPELRGLTYKMAVNKKIITENIPLEENSTVALLPPFSGG